MTVVQIRDSDNRVAHTAGLRSVDDVWQERRHQHKEDGKQDYTCAPEEAGQRLAELLILSLRGK